MNKLISILLVLSVVFLVGCKDEELALLIDDGPGVEDDDKRTQVIDDPVPPETPVPSPLNKLVGNVQFFHAFFDSDTLLRLEADFPKVILNRPKTAEIVKDFDANIFCRVSPGDYDFLCLKVFESSAMVLFQFDVVSNNPVEGEGIFEFCSEDFTQVECLGEIIDDPDGVVIVKVESTTSRISNSKARSFDMDNTVNNASDVNVYSEGLDMDNYDESITNNIEKTAERDEIQQIIQELIDESKITIE